MANMGCYLLETYLEDKKYLIALEKDKTNLLSGALRQNEEKWQSN